MRLSLPPPLSLSETSTSSSSRGPLSPPLSGVVFSSGQEAIKYIKDHAAHHNYDMSILSSKGHGPSKSWRLGCTGGTPLDGDDEGGSQEDGEGDGSESCDETSDEGAPYLAGSTCPFAVLVKPVAESKGAPVKWQIIVKNFHGSHGPARITTAHYLSRDEKQYLASRLDTHQPAELIAFLVEERVRAGKPPLLHHQLVYDYLSLLRRRRNIS